MQDLTYNSQIIEKKWQNYWLTNNTYQWHQHIPRSESFVIDTPPPTVSGLLHMGHMFSYCQTDFIARYQRMRGKNVFYPMGFDDNGLPTERLVEKTKGIKAAHMQREEFIDICNEVVKAAENDFKELFQAAALSIDWNLTYRSISPHAIKMSQMSFLDLFEKNRAYRKLEPCLWDVVDQTALAQADIVELEFASSMNHITFSTTKGEQITIATTRPELLAACVGVFYHPDDKRYQHLSGTWAISPLFGIKVPILADEAVDIEKGTGLVMCCTFGDITDIHWWKKHQLNTRVIINKAGRLEQHIEEDWQALDIAKARSYAEKINGLKIKEARSKILELLQEENLLVAQIPITHHVKCAERSGSPLEIIISAQWFVKVMDLKETLLVKAEQCQWHPAHMKIRLENWIKGLNWDWCISRQRFFGVPFPVWYSTRVGEEGKILIANMADLPVNPLSSLPKGYSRDEVIPDYDVMDTWATSSISPQLNSHAINKEYAIDYQRHEQLFPADLRPQAHEIIRTWTFYTMLKAQIHEDNIPWKNIMISGWCLAADKTKMSKSKGNVITPHSLLLEKGADVVRYWASTSKLGVDTAYSEDLLKIGKKLVNKLWNAAKFCAPHIAKITKDAKATADIDLWLLSKLYRVIEKATHEFEHFEYCNARVVIEEFFWRDFCDNYLELVKVRVYDEQNIDPLGQLSAIYTLHLTIETLLKLFAPFMPHLTEEIYQHLFGGKHASIHDKGTWPVLKNYAFSGAKELVGDIAIELLELMRKYKSGLNLSLKSSLVEVIIASKNQEDLARVENILTDLKNVSNALAIKTQLYHTNGAYFGSTGDEKYYLEIVV